MADSDSDDVVPRSDAAVVERMRARLERLEIELAHQQRTTEQLDEVIQQLSKEVLRLARQHDSVLKKLDDLRSRPTEPYVRNLEDEKPPHY